MSYSMPDYIHNANIATPIIRYIWDDTRASSDFKYETGDLIHKLKAVSLRGKRALGIGIYEWIIWRYHSLSDDPDHEEERRGPLVAREALDPSFDYHPDQAPELLDNFLSSVWPISSGRITTANPSSAAPKSSWNQASSTPPGPCRQNRLSGGSKENKFCQRRWPE